MEKNYFEWIEGYLNDELSVADRNEFEQALSDSEELRGQVEVYPLAEKLLDIALAQEIHDIIDQVKEEPGTKVVPMKKRSNVRRLMALAASLLLLATVGFGWMMSGRYSSEGIASTYFEQYDAGVLLGDGDSDVYSQAIIAYQKEDYATAASLFSSITPEDGNYITANFYLGVSKLSTGELTAAETAFNIVASADDPQLREPTDWYLAMTALSAGDDVEARSRLEAITANSGHYYATKAQEVLDDMGTVWHGWFK